MEDSFLNVLRSAQEYISARYSSIVGSQSDQLKAYIEKYLSDNNISVTGYSQKELTDKLYSEMAGYSILDDLLCDDNIEEININAWDNITVTYRGGKMITYPEHFTSPEYAQVIIRRLLRQSGMIIDNAMPVSQGHLEGNMRIAALKEPIVDRDISVATSIRKLHPSSVDVKQLIKSKTGSKQMIDFLAFCMRYDISTLFVGKTSSGKTTVLNALLETLPINKRIYTVENGARELNLVRRDENGKAVNSVVHTLSRPSDNPTQDVPQSLLVTYALRFNPDYLVMGEMRDKEATDTVDAGNTGVTVFSTTHSFAASNAHKRVADLYRLGSNLDLNSSIEKAAEAFPLVVFCYKLETGDRKIMDISECEVLEDGTRRYKTLFRYRILENVVGKKGNLSIKGEFEQVNEMSEFLKNRLMQSGAPQKEIDKFRMVNGNKE